jgi:hypothetical protein
MRFAPSLSAEELGGVSTMRAVLVAFLLLTSSAGSAQSQSAAQWWFFGGDESASSFLAAGDIQRKAEGHLEVWTKFLSTEQLKGAVKSAVKDPERLKSTAAARHNAPSPHIAQVVKPSKDDLTDIALQEDVANNSPEVVPVAKKLIEVDCSAKLIRTLSI